jgi:hypothetical protein
MGPIWRFVVWRGEDEDIRKGCKKVNMVEILCTLV